MEVTDDAAVVAGERDNRKYGAEVALEAEVDPESGRTESNDGILRVFFLLRDNTNKGFRRVDFV